jgi:hypothetical protein
MNPLYLITTLILKLITSTLEKIGIKLIKELESLKMNRMLLRRIKD